jgi:hypothetical protein
MAEYTESIQLHAKCRLWIAPTSAARDYCCQRNTAFVGKMSANNPAEPPRSGVYQIRCMENDKIYIRSAVNLARRWKLRLRDLRRGSHPDAHLQSAWKLYGERSFEFSVLEYAEQSEVLQREQAWIQLTRCTDPGIGFNVNLHVTAAGRGIGRVWRGFRNPAGGATTIVNLYDFCRRHHLDFPSMHRLSRGTSKLKPHQGWTHLNSVRQRAYIKTHRGYVDPTGREYPAIRNLAALCRAHGLQATHMVA